MALLRQIPPLENISKRVTFGKSKTFLVILVPSSVAGAVGMVGRDDECLLDDPEWPEAKVDLRVGLTDLLDSFGYHYVSLPNSDINNPAVVEYFSNSEMELFVYSGYGGSILRAPILSLGKFFLHVHGGFCLTFAVVLPIITAY